MPTFYSQRKKFIYIHIPKTAGSSVSNYLMRFCDDPIKRVKFFGALLRRVDEYLKIPIFHHSKLKYYHPHCTFDDILKKYDFVKQSLVDCKIVVIVRDPVERLLSEYQYLRQKKMKYIDTKAYLSAQCSFDEFIESERFRTKTMVEYFDPRLFDEDQMIIVSTNKLNSSWKDILEYLNIPETTLTDKNVTKKSKETIPSEYSKELIRKKFNDDYIAYSNYL